MSNPSPPNESDHRPHPEEQPPAPSDASRLPIAPGEQDRATAPTGRAVARFLGFVEWLGNLLPHPVSLFALFALGVVLLSGVAAAIGLEAADPRPGHEGEMFVVRSLMSGDGGERLVGRSRKPQVGPHRHSFTRERQWRFDALARCGADVV